MDPGFVAGLFVPVSAAGGTVTDIVQNGQNYRVHTFNSNGTFSVSNSGMDGVVEYLMVGGGGGGSNGNGGIVFGAGGASGVQRIGSFVATAGNYTITRGVQGGGGFRGNGAAGGSSTITRSGFSTITATGGNGAVQYSRTGASNADFVGSTFGSGIYAGGGAGANGNGRIIGSRGHGGLAAESSFTGTSVKRGGGGGGYDGVNNSGDGLGSFVGQFGGVAPGVANSGSGGGGGFEDFNGPGGAAGSTGVVIIRYRLGFA